MEGKDYTDSKSQVRGKSQIIVRSFGEGRVQVLIEVS